MKASGTFKVIENKFFGAVALPTEKGGSFIIALPKEKISLSLVEAAIIKSGRTLETFVETVSNHSKKKVKTLNPEHLSAPQPRPTILPSPVAVLLAFHDLIRKSRF